MSNIAVIFYSRDGSTKAAASCLAERLEGDLVELKEKRPSSFMGGAFKALRKKGKALVGKPWEDCTSQDIWVLGTPVWAGNGTPALNSFLNQADFRGKKVYLFTVQADPGLKASDVVAGYYKGQIEARGGIFKDSLSLKGASLHKTVAKESIKDKLDAWNIG